MSDEDNEERLRKLEQEVNERHLAGDIEGARRAQTELRQARREHAYAHWSATAPPIGRLPKELPYTGTQWDEIEKAAHGVPLGRIAKHALAYSEAIDPNAPWRAPKDIQKQLRALKPVLDDALTQLRQLGPEARQLLRQAGVSEWLEMDIETAASAAHEATASLPVRGAPPRFDQHQLAHALAVELHRATGWPIEHKSGDREGQRDSKFAPALSCLFGLVVRPIHLSHDKSETQVTNRKFINGRAAVPSPTGYSGIIEATIKRLKRTPRSGWKGIDIIDPVVAQAIDSIAFEGRAAEQIAAAPTNEEWAAVNRFVESAVHQQVVDPDPHGLYPWGDICVFVPPRPA